jgi:hypothetical protein
VVASLGVDNNGAEEADPEGCESAETREEVGMIGWAGRGGSREWGTARFLV